MYDQEFKIEVKGKCKYGCLKSRREFIFSALWLSIKHILIYIFAPTFSELHHASVLHKYTAYHFWSGKYFNFRLPSAFWVARGARFTPELFSWKSLLLNLLNLLRRFAQILLQQEQTFGFKCNSKLNIGCLPFNFIIKIA